MTSKKYRFANIIDDESHTVSKSNRYIKQEDPKPNKKPRKPLKKPAPYDFPIANHSIDKPKNAIMTGIDRKATLNISYAEDSSPDCSKKKTRKLEQDSDSDEMGIYIPKKSIQLKNRDSDSEELGPRKEKQRPKKSNKSARCSLVSNTSTDDIVIYNNRPKAYVDDVSIYKKPTDVSTYKKPAERRTAPISYAESDDEIEPKLLFKVPTKSSKFSTLEQLEHVLDPEIESINTDTISCPVGPFCTVKLSLPFSIELQERYDSYLQAQVNFEKGNITKTAFGSARDRFCNYHQALVDIIPKGIKKGYQTKIQFTKIPTRMQEFKNRLEKIIHQQIPSSFFQQLLELYKTKGKFKAQSTIY